MTNSSFSITRSFLIALLGTISPIDIQRRFVCMLSMKALFKPHQREHVNIWIILQMISDPFLALDRAHVCFKLFWCEVRLHFHLSSILKWNQGHSHDLNWKRGALRQISYPAWCENSKFQCLPIFLSWAGVYHNSLESVHHCSLLFENSFLAAHRSQDIYQINSYCYVCPIGFLRSVKKRYID